MTSMAGAKGTGGPSVPFPLDPKRRLNGVDRRQRPRESGERSIEQELASEHEVLAAWRERLGRLPSCPAASARGATCQHPAQSACREGTLALAEQMLLFMSEHFSREDGVMRRGRGPATPHPQFDLHVEEQGTIIQTLVEALVQPSPCKWRQAMQTIVESRFPRHLHTHDEVLRRFLAR
ncbi:MAG: hypothetical protein ACKPE6_00385 [Gammaproteobacteria bacterium]